LKTKIRPQTIGIIPLGCAKNLVDTEVLMRQLDANRFRLVVNPETIAGIDTVIINTCGFILDARKESIDLIMRYVHEKQQGRLSRLFVMGCLSERYEDQLRAEIPEVDDFFGVNDLVKIVNRVGGEVKTGRFGERQMITPAHYAYLKIAEGCNRNCSFCAIPMIRGKYRSRRMKDIITEARSLAARGVKEVNIISQDTTLYGVDLYHRKNLAQLLESLAGIPGLEWIRLHYTYPEGFPLEVLDIMKQYPNICHYIDIPLQHISSRILKSMRRGINGGGTRKLLNIIREHIPDISIRTSLIVGYPGETAKEFAELRDFVMAEKFDRLGVFTYSHEEGTEAFGLKDNIPGSVKRKRADEIMQIQEEISLELNMRKVGSVMKVLVDREENEFFAGRSEHDSPEVDNEVLIRKSGTKIKPGNFYHVLITEAMSFDLTGEILS
jgi:ribosomal protein S12 methylthiotransferase